jgi:hypothetical protein
MDLLIRFLHPILKFGNHLFARIAECRLEPAYINVFLPVVMLAADSPCGYPEHARR